MKKTLILLATAFTGFAFSQVGINTPNPKASLDIQSKGNTSSTKAMKINNSNNTEMVTVTDAGWVGVGAVVPKSNLQVIGDEMRLGGPSSQTGTVANPIVRIHSNANTDDAGGSLFFSENAQDFGYYIKHNTASGNIGGMDGLAMGAAQAGKYPYNPARPGIFIADNQHIGLGTATPQMMFHIDGARDNNINSAPTPAQQGNDVVVNASGNIGIGTVSPGNKLDIRSAANGAVRIVDGTEGANKILTSDANGVATWQRAASNVAVGALGSGYDLPFSQFSEYRYTGSTITLPPGKWMITVSLLIVPSGVLTINDWIFVRSTFSEDNLTTIGQAGVQSPDVIRPTLMSFQMTGPFGGGQKYNVATGSVQINNKSATAKTYRYVVGNTQASSTVTGAQISKVGGSWSENAIYAISVN